MDFLQLEQWKIEIIKGASDVLDEPSSIFKTINHLNQLHDQLHGYVMKIVDTELRKRKDLPPFSYCWVEMGSGGRGERTLWTDQDNGIIYYCVEKDEPLVIGFLRELADKVIYTLNEIGYPLCQGGVMANNPRWLQSVEGWKSNWIDWSSSLSLDNIRYLLISSDIRPLYGDRKLADGLKQWLYEKVKTHSSLQRIASYSLHQHVPIGIFKNLFTERFGPYTGMFNLKEGGYYQLVSLVRVLSFYAGVTSSSTQSRIDMLTKLGHITSYDPWELALSFFLKARLKNHIQLFMKKEKVHDFISLSTYSKSEVKQLKEHLHFLKTQQKYWEKVLGNGGDVREFI